MMFEKYMKERQGADCLKTEKGFLFYKVEGQECFIADMYIEPEFRKSGVFEGFIDALSEIALMKSCKAITATIYLNDKGCNRTLNAAFKVGFKLAQANNNVLFIVKEL
jgi:hypothetical protein